MEVAANFVGLLMITNIGWETIVDLGMVKTPKEVVQGKLKGDLKWGVLRNVSCIGVWGVMKGWDW